MDMESFRKGLRETAARFPVFCREAGKWLLFSVVTGFVCGLLGSAFHIGVEKVTELRLAHPWILYTLPAAAVAAVALYKLFGTEGENTDTILRQVQEGGGIRLALLPAIFLTTVLTHLAGGSAGREGAALQMGGSAGYGLARLFRMDEDDRRTATMVGMAGFFSALFGTPFGAALFSITVINVGTVSSAALLPCLLSALTAAGVAKGFGIEPTAFAVAVPAMTGHGVFLKVAALAVLAGLLSVVFCTVLHLFEKGFHHRIPNVWLRALAGGAILLGLTLLEGSGDYNGAGMNVIRAAVEQGQAKPAAFLLKILFTAVTLSVGFKGGEVVPAFFTGAVFGCVAGPLLGLPAGFAAAVGMIALFCGAVNCPVASVALAAEMFGGEGLVYWALACALSFAVSGYSGLYFRQRFLHDKLTGRAIDRTANN